MNAWGYFAVSTPEQADSLPAQEQWALDVCAQQGWTLERSFSAPGSGKNGPRALLQRMLAELRSLAPELRPGVILMVRLDRVGRGRMVDSQIVLAEIAQLGCRIYTREEGFVKNDSWTDELITAVRIAVARSENEARADKSRAGHARRRAQGLHVGTVPFGIVLLDGRPIAHEPEAGVVREIFNHRLAGWGTHRLARLAASIAPPKLLTNGKVRPLRWGPTTVAYMLRRETYRGVVVDPETWDRVQDITMRGLPTVRTTRVPWPLRGAVRCTCGLALSGANTGPKGRRIRYYTCRNVAVHAHYPFHRADRLEAQFERLLERLRGDPNVMLELPAPDVDSLQARKRELRGELQRLDTRRRKAWELAEDDRIPGDELARRIDEVAKERERAQAALTSTEREIIAAQRSESAIRSAADVIALFAEVWNEIDEDYQREIAQAVAPLVGGLWCSPQSKHVLINGFDVARDARCYEQQKCDHIRSFATTVTALAALAVRVRGRRSP